MLTPEQRLRYARHLSLVELGVAGQVALLAADVGPALSDAEAEAIRLEYLLRAGIPAISAVPAGPSPDDVARTAALEVGNSDVDVDVPGLAGADYLRHAAAGVIGAFHAVERIKQVTGVGRRAALASELRLIKDA